jgi:hypothetical protein
VQHGRAGGCFSCHTAAGGQKLAGGRALTTRLGLSTARTSPPILPNITPDPGTGIGKWEKADLVDLLQTGSTPEQSKVKGAMREVIEDGVKYLSEAGRGAIADYVFAQPPIVHEVTRKR